MKKIHEKMDYFVHLWSSYVGAIFIKKISPTLCDIKLRKFVFFSEI